MRQLSSSSPDESDSKTPPPLLTIADPTGESAGHSSVEALSADASEPSDTSEASAQEITAPPAHAADVAPVTEQEPVLEESDSASEPSPSLKRRNFKRNVVVGAIAVSVLPTLVIGGIATLSYQQLRSQIAQSQGEEVVATVDDQQSVLSISTGIIAILAGVIATLMAYQALRPLRLVAISTNRLVEQLRRGESESSSSPTSAEKTMELDEIEQLSNNLKFLTAQTLKLRSQRALDVNSGPVVTDNAPVDQGLQFLEAKAATITAISQTAFQQTKKVDATYRDLVTISNRVRDILASLQQGAGQGRSMGQAAQVGQQTIEQIKEHHASMWVSLIEAATKVQGLGQPVQRLEKVLSHVGSVTATVKLTAMNAALEAARMGEMGQSFSSIGEELHTLVRQLDEGIVEIEQLMSELKTEIQATETRMTLGQQQASSGKLLMVVAQQQLSQITTLASQLEIESGQTIETVTEQAQTTATASESMVEVATLTSQITEQAALLTEALDARINPITEQ